jgi:outer membrane protein assembly factor BamB
VEMRRYDRFTSERRRRERRRRLVLRWLVLVACMAIAVLAILIAVHGRGDDDGTAGSGSSTSTTATESSSSTGSSGSTDSASTTDEPDGTTTSATAGTSSPNTTIATYNAAEPGDTRVAGTFYGPINTAFEGLTTFRGNASRTYYGEGPVPSDPEILWKFGPMSGKSTDLGETSTWTGTGWTGQPCIFERDGETWVVFGAYDYKIHFLDAETGDRLLPDFEGADLMKGTGAVDPDGYPLIYYGCRDNKWRIIAIDRDEPTELWCLDADELPDQIWNDDWDGSAIIRNDYAFEGGENGHFYIVKLNRGYDSDGKVTVDPVIVRDFQGWTDDLLADLGSKDVGIENSVCLVGDRVYFSNSGGLVSCIDVSASLRELTAGEELPKGKASFPLLFQYWTGSDTDATIVADEQGYLYICQHSDARSAKGAPRAAEVGQIIKFDPRKAEAGESPIVWSQPVTLLGSNGEAGVWATPCIYKNMVYVPTNNGALLGINRETGEKVFRKELTDHAWASCIVVDQTLIVGDTYGVLHAWDVSDTSIDPPVDWEYTFESQSALESTAAVWKGKIFQGCRDGYFYCLSDIGSPH